MTKTATTTSTSTRPGRRRGASAPADGQDTAGQDTAGQDTAGQDTAGQDTAGQDTAGQDTAGQDTAGQETGPATGDVEGAAPDTAADPLSWVDVLPLVAMKIGSRPSAAELRAARTVWQVLQVSPDQTAMQIAANAEIMGTPGIEGKIVTKILDRFSRAGMATGQDGAGGVRRWRAGSPDTIAADADTASQGLVREPGSPAGNGTALPSGALRGMVEDFLIENPDRDWTSTEIANKIGRSSGAVNNALFTLCEHGSAVLTAESPRRFRYQGENSDTTTDGPTDGTADGADTGDTGE